MHLLNYVVLHQLQQIRQHSMVYWLMIITCVPQCVVAQLCLNGDQLSQWRVAKFDPSQNPDPSTDQHKIWNGWLCPWDDPLCKISSKFVHWGFFDKWVKCNRNFCISVYPFLMTRLQIRPLGGFFHVMAEMTRFHARVCLLGNQNSKLIFNP